MRQETLVNKKKCFFQVANKKILEYFHKKNSKIKKPFFFVKITTDSSKIDVNIEPNKDKIFIANEVMRIEYLFNILHSKIKQWAKLDLLNFS